LLVLLLRYIPDEATVFTFTFTQAKKFAKTFTFSQVRKPNTLLNTGSCGHSVHYLILLIEESVHCNGR